MYARNNPIKYTDPTGLQVPMIGAFWGASSTAKEYSEYKESKNISREMRSKDNYNDFMDSNPPLVENRSVVTNFSNYIKYDDEGRPYTNKDGTVVLNGRGSALLKANNANIEAADVYHEKESSGSKVKLPAIKIVMQNGGEHIYKMFSGEVDNRIDTKGTPNRAAGPYKDTENSAMESLTHGEFDIYTYIKNGSGRDDSQGFFSEVSRFGKVISGASNPNGSEYRNVEGEDISLESEIIYSMGTQ